MGSLDFRASIVSIENHSSPPSNPHLLSIFQIYTGHVIPTMGYRCLWYRTRVFQIGKANIQLLKTLPRRMDH